MRGGRRVTRVVVVGGVFAIDVVANAFSFSCGFFTAAAAAAGAIIIIIIKMMIMLIIIVVVGVAVVVVFVKEVTLC